MKKARRWHLYLSCFFAPMLLFYLGTGWYQTLNTNRNKSAGEAEDLVSKLTSVHVDQIYPTKADSYSPKVFKVLVVLMSLCLIATIGLGLYLAFRSVPTPWPVVAALALGVVVPVVALWLGQTG
jgi:hypothetical protein